MNDFLQLVASRQSDRAYDMTRAVEPEKLERILADSSGSVTTTNFHGCALQADGARQAAANIRSNFSGSTARVIS